jgi:hypothetical protein
MRPFPFFTCNQKETKCHTTNTRKSLSRSSGAVGMKEKVRNLFIKSQRVAVVRKRRRRRLINRNHKVCYARNPPFKSRSRMFVHFRGGGLKNPLAVSLDFQYEHLSIPNHRNNLLRRGGDQAAARVTSALSVHQLLRPRVGIRAGVVSSHGAGVEVVTANDGRAGDELQTVTKSLKCLCSRCDVRCDVKLYSGYRDVCAWCVAGIHLNYNA